MAQGEDIEFQIGEKVYSHFKAHSVSESAVCLISWTRGASQINPLFNLTQLKQMDMVPLQKDRRVQGSEET